MSYEWNENSGMETMGLNYQEPDNHHNNPKKKKKSGVVKKAGALILSGVLFGTVAAGSFQAVNYLADSRKADTQVSNTVADAENETQEQSGNGSANSSDKIALSTYSQDDKTSGQSLDVSAIAKGSLSSIVAITNKTVTEVESYFGSMFGMQSEPQVKETESRGSGIIIGQNDTELLIVTNNHVIDGADTLSVCFVDNEAYEALVKGKDAAHDLAVVAVKLADISEETMASITVAAMGDSESLEVGEQVVAIGNALGYGQSVTTGIVSAMNRQVTIDNVTNNLIQTDAAINPGNSGGALLNMRGEVIGINSAKYSSTDVEGIGYAIPMATAKPIIEELMNRSTREKVDESQKSYLGVTLQEVTSQAAEVYNLPVGLCIYSMESGGPAEAAGLQVGYVITAFDGNSVSTKSELKELLEYYAAGETVDITAQVSDNGSYVEKHFSVTLGQAPAANNNRSDSGNTIGNLEDFLQQQEQYGVGR